MLHKILDFSSGLVQTLFPSQPEVTFEEPPRFDATAWKTHYRIDVEDVPVPLDLQQHLDQPCPFWGQFKTRQTHLLCLIPGGLTSQEIWERAQAGNLSTDVKDKVIPRKPYWILITTKTLPGSRSKSLLEQKRDLEVRGYDVPTVLEASIAKLALQASKKMQIYQYPTGCTRCHEEVDGFPVAIGSKDEQHLTVVYNDWNGLTGIAAIYKADT